tara:strand:- start:875 stop:1063 length:189 start_codon:yes stop_codon:yes gene_type:complete
MNNFLKLAVLNIIIVVFFGDLTILIVSYIKTNKVNFTLLITGVILIFFIFYLSREIWHVYKK